MVDIVAITVHYFKFILNSPAIVRAIHYVVAHYIIFNLDLLIVDSLVDYKNKANKHNLCIYSDFNIVVINKGSNSIVIKLVAR